MLKVVEPATERVLDEVAARRRRGGRRRRGRRPRRLPGVARGGARATAPGCWAGIAVAVEEQLEELAVLEARNAGKPIADARGEMGMVADVFRYYAGAPERPIGDTIPVAGGLGLTVREPLGVVGLIIAVELPAGDRRLEAGPGARRRQHRRAQAGRADAADRAALRAAGAARPGCPRACSTSSSGRARPPARASSSTPTWRRSPSPARPRSGATIAAGAAADDQARHARAGRQVGQHRVRRRRPGRAAAAAAPLAVFGNAGQDCCARSRILVERSALDRFMEALEEAVEAIVVGDPLDEATQMGPLISAAHRDAGGVLRARRRPVAIRGTRAGRSRATGSRRPCCARSTPTIAPCREEIFGPVVPRSSRSATRPRRSRWPTTRSTACRARSGRATARRALRVARAIDTGVLSINSNTSVRVTTPFGGFKQSGYGRELGPHALDAYTEVKTIYYATGQA